MESVWRTISEPALIPLFLGRQGCNITFVLYVSDTDPSIMGSVKGLLIQTLLKKASLRDSSFNLLQFSNKVNWLSPRMLPCAPHTVYRALSWIHSTSSGPGRDLLAALNMAFTDPACDAVHLLCTDLPEQPEVGIVAEKPVNVFYLQESDMQLNNQTRKYLQCLSQATGGSCHVIFYDLRGAFGKVIPLCVAGSPSSLPTVCPSKCSSTSISAPLIPSPSLRCSVGNVFCPHSSCVQSKENLCSPNFFPGCRVLARRQLDGFYSVGSVIQPVQSCRDVWIVQFDSPVGGGLGTIANQHHMVCSLDMVNDRRAHTHSLVVGDAVLSPWEPNLQKYGPGRVVAAAEGGDGSSDVRSLQVLMWNSSVSLVPDILALPLSSSQYERIVMELQNSNPDPRLCCSFHYSHTSCFPPQMFCNDCCPSRSSLHSNHTCVVPPSRGSMFVGEEEFDGMRKSLEDGDAMRINQEELSYSSSLEDGTSSSKSKAVKPQSKQRPPWRYWRRTGPEPQHKHPGSPSSQRTPQPVKFIIPILQLNRASNPSALFQSFPGTTGRKADITNLTHQCCGMLTSSQHNTLRNK